MSTIRLTVAQALVRFLAVQHSERDGVEQRLVQGCFGIFGHGNVAGVGEALLESELKDPTTLPYHQARNEQGMVHAAVAYARMRNRLSTLACTTSIGPGATNLVTGAALATVNRLPVLLLPGDVFATRASGTVLQELESPRGFDVTVNDSLRPVSAYFDRVWRPEQLPSSLLGAMRVLTDPAETGAVTIALPQDVQAEAHDWPVELFEHRTWHVSRPRPESGLMARVAELVRGARRPMVVAGGGVIYAEATEALRALCEATGLPVGQTQAGKGSLAYDHPQSLGAVGATGTAAANEIAREADLVIGVGTRWQDFTTASRSVFANPDVRFVNINVAALDTVKQSGLAVLADAREALVELTHSLEGWSVDPEQRERATRLSREWDEQVAATYAVDGVGDRQPTQGQVIGMVNEVSGPRDVVLCAAGSMPGDLHRLWRTRDPKGYHVEYGYSCMGYEIAGGLGAKMATPDRQVFVMVGDGSYLMMAQELVTAVQEGVKLVVVLVQNHGYASIGSLSQSLGSQRFGTAYRFRTSSGRLDGDRLPVDLAANAQSLGAEVIRVETLDQLRPALEQASANERTTVVHVDCDPIMASPDNGAWWDVPVSEVSELDTTQAARTTYEEHKTGQRHHLAPFGSSD
ncbi:MAG TPA: 3D-(3,5/4)-trihydroxycyclohexane-1,2-dione acylhydrolase (decyclizing) [Actinomycetales bacterium]